MSENQFRSGFAALIGRPNVGKSTLLNRLIGEKVAIVSNKPQTTRNVIQGVLTGDGYQIIFIDTPGIHKPKTRLAQNMVKTAENASDGVDVVLFLTEPKTRVKAEDAVIIDRLMKQKTPVFLVVNKADTISKPELLNVMAAYKDYGFAEIVPVSALKGDNTDNLIKVVAGYLPNGPKYFPDDTLTDKPERFIASEMIREKALFFLQDEIPHGIAVEITSMKERESRALIDIEATVYCEKESHKGIVIGKKGAVLKEIGTRARMDISRLLGCGVNLQLWVKVKENWRDSDFYVRNFT
jgi:GTP-binding protein Era